MAAKENFVEDYNVNDYGSEFECDSEAERKRSKRYDLATGEKRKRSAVASKRELSDEYDKEEGRKQRFHILSLDAYARHKKYINDYLLYYCGSQEEFKRDTSRDRTDIDVIRENHQFLWEEDDPDDSWEKRLAKSYYDKLFKEYCIVDLSRYKENKVAMRWRVEKEVVSGKGQFNCGEKYCKETEGMRSWEVNFAYMEHGQKKNALVKVRLCPDCSYKLNYRHKRKEVNAKRKSDASDKDIPHKKHKALDEETDKDIPHKKHKALDEETETQDKTKDGAKSESTASKQGKEEGTTGKEAGKKGEGCGDEDKSLWSGPAPIAEESTREDEFQEYFDGMFM